MANALSTYVRDSLLNWISGVAFPTEPTTIYCSLHSGDQGRAGTSNDITTTIRAAGRVAIPVADIDSATAAGNSRVVKVTSTTDFGASAGGATITNVGFWDASTGGNFIIGGSLTVSKVVNTSDPVSFAPNAIKFIAT
jgi:hypothetical protein